MYVLMLDHDPGHTSSSFELTFGRGTSLLNFPVGMATAGAAGASCRCSLGWYRAPLPRFQLRQLRCLAAKGEGKGVNGFDHSNGESSADWQNSLSSNYLQQGMDDFCLALEEVLTSQWDNDEEERTGMGSSHDVAEGIWAAIRREAQADAATEPLLSSFLYASILSHDTFERSLAFVLANRLSDATLLSTELFEVFHQVLRNNKNVSQAALADIAAVRERDPSCRAYSQALLYFKGFHSIQVHRIAHQLWQSGRKVMATALQSRTSEVFAVDIHPAAQMGKGVLLDHGTGVVIGETAVVGDYVSILQNVTLGGTGKELGDRHPKIGANVLIGASATILGNITIGQGAQVAAGSLVLKPVPPGTMVAGSPAKEVGSVTGNPAQKMDQWVREAPDIERPVSPAGRAGPPAPQQQQQQRRQRQEGQQGKGQQRQQETKAKQPKGQATREASRAAQQGEAGSSATPPPRTEPEYFI